MKQGEFEGLIQRVVLAGQSVANEQNILKFTHNDLLFHKCGASLHIIPHEKYVLFWGKSKLAYIPK
ncbi:hypothetical protein THOE12_70176 [Vibrio rotiferianus]|nr:hypothetical protein THOE12_70176 [Vibrio rotiferianus]